MFVERGTAAGQLGDWFGCRLPSRFTTFEEEYRFARESVAFADKNYRAFFELTGPDRVRYLNAIVTNDVRELSPGRGIVSLLLNPQGHILAEIETYALPDRLLVVSYRMIQERLRETLDKYIIMDDVTLEDTTEQFAAYSLEGPKSAEAVGALCGTDLNSLTELGHTETRVGEIPCRIMRRSPGGTPGAEFIVEAAQREPLRIALLAATRRLGGGPIGYETLNVLRLEAGIPWFGYDFDDSVIPQEAGLEDSHVSFTKGCYTGQEIVERVRSRGHVNRRRVGLAFTTKEVPAAKSALLAEGKNVGHVTRAGYSPKLGQAIGMGYLRREFSEPGTPISLANGEARVLELPLQDT